MKDGGSKKKVWTKTRQQNLVKHNASGIYYVRVRIGKKNAHRESLKTTVYEIALARMRPAIEELQARRPLRSGEAPTTLWDALRIVGAQIEADPTLKERSRATYRAVIRSLQPGRKMKLDFESVPVPDGPLLKLHSADLESWWKRTAARYAPARANFQLLFVRRALKTAKEMQAIARDLAAKLKRVPVPRTELNLITSEQFAALITAIAAEPWVGKEAAEWVELVAYTGMRPEEANSARWEHLDRAKNVIRVTGNETGTKNREERHVPITDKLAGLLERIQARTGALSGKILTVRNPVKLIHRGCAAIGVRPMDRYSFRHLFATRCAESGVEASVFSKWLGHKDGGALALKVYVHPTSEHEQRSAARVQF